MISKAYSTSAGRKAISSELCRGAGHYRVDAGLCLASTAALPRRWPHLSGLANLEDHTQGFRAICNIRNETLLIISTIFCKVMSGIEHVAAKCLAPTLPPTFRLLPFLNSGLI
jgi:hypothetical protein